MIHSERDASKTVSNLPKKFPEADFMVASLNAIAYLPVM